MAEAIVSIGLQKLCDLLSQEYEQFQGVEDQVTELKRELELLSSFLKDAEAKKQTSEVVRKVVEQIKDIIYDAEDTIETFVQKEKLRDARGIKNRIRRLACIIPERRKLAVKIGGISKRISTVTCAMENHGVQKTIANVGYIVQPLQERQKEIRKEFCRDHESDFVGLETNVKTLVGYLVEKDDIRIVSVTGMGGLGKTTLARQVFNLEVVTHHFDRLAWVCVSQEFTRISLWQTILQNLTSKERKGEILQMKEDELQDELYGLLETSKALIVIDDIWKEEDWDLIKPIFPPKKDWKVLLTSRNESVAMCRDTTYINFKPECLTIQDSWTLFQRIAMPRKDAPGFKVNTEMEEMAKDMIKHCGGLPLAVKVLGGLLAENYTVHDWKRLSENIGSHVVIGRTSGSSIDHVLSLSFEELPSYLKHCFLYLAHFPEDHKIWVEDLSYLWAAEGISKSTRNNGESIRDVVDGCIEELVRRNMLISKRSIETLRFESCRLHDMMREVCLIKAKGENFLQIVGSASSSSSTADSQSGTSRRLVLHNPTTASHVEGDLNNPKLRSLVIVWSDFGKEWMVSGLNLSRLQMMRVLDLSYAKFEGGKLPSSIGKLIHLRYLSLKMAKVSHLPYSLRNLKLLIYLNLYTRESIFVPNVLMGMQELKYLELPESMHKKTKLELRNLKKLETLENFSTKNGSIEDLHGMVRLRFLRILLNNETSLETVSASISGLKHLEFLNIIDRSDISSDKRVEEGILLDFIHLKRLQLSIESPRQQRFPSHLTVIKLGYCGLEEDPMPILEKLLQLKVVCLNDQSFTGRRIVCSDGGFPQLHRLEFDGLEEWEEWIVEEGSMPLLHDLKIWDCPKLKEVPEGFISLGDVPISTNPDLMGFEPTQDEKAESAHEEEAHNKSKPLKDSNKQKQNTTNTEPALTRKKNVSTVKTLHQKENLEPLQILSSDSPIPAVG